MKRLVVTIGSALMAAWSGAVELQALPRSEFADTEASTNCPFDFWQQSTRNFRFAMNFIGTVSNNVQLAFGCDADTNGVLTAEETDMTFAWECGAWQLRNLDGRVAFEEEAATTNAVKDLSWDLRLSRRRPKQLTVSENGETLFAALADAPAEWLYSEDWNMFRVTVRGVDAPNESVNVSLNVQGHVFILR